MAAEIEEDAATARTRTGGRAARSRGDPGSGPDKPPQAAEESPAPPLSRASKAVRHYFYEGFSWFVAAYRTAAEKLQRGDLDPHFPRGGSRQPCRSSAGKAEAVPGV